MAQFEFASEVHKTDIAERVARQHSCHANATKIRFDVSVIGCIGFFDAWLIEILLDQVTT